MSVTQPVLRPLPPRPSLEFERKEAKALLRLLRAGDPDALARARSRHPALYANAARQPRLADAQLVIAREYGFASWPRLVRYFEDAERIVLRTPSAVNPGLWLPEAYLESVQHFMAQHQRRATSAARSLISYVPRFEGMSHEEVFASAMTEDDARLALARSNAYASWDVFMERVTAAAAERTQFRGLERSPWRRAFDVMQTGDLSQLQTLVRAHPALLHPTEYEVATTMHIFRLVVDRERLDVEQGVGRDRMQPIIEWLVSQGFDLQRELDIRLCGDLRMMPADVQYWIDRGANPNWIAPNGYSVLEHAVVRYSNPDAIDHLAQYATVRQPALWLAAGLGDIEGIARFLDRNGRPTAAARKPRPRFDAIGTRAFGRASDDADEILMEAAIVAFLNDRTGVMEYLASRGLPVNTLRWDMPFVVMAVGNHKVKMVETLVRCGADLDLRGAYNGSAREMARDMLESQPPDEDRRRIADLCGLNADEILAARDARPAPTPLIDDRLAGALRLASDDARRLQQGVVSAEHLMFGLLRAGFPAMEAFQAWSGLDAERFAADVKDRVLGKEDVLAGETLPLDADAQAFLDTATSIATEHRRETVRTNHLLLALTQQSASVAVRTFERYGGNVSKVNEFLLRMR